MNIFDSKKEFERIQKERVDSVKETIEKQKEIFYDRSSKYGIAYITHAKLLMNLFGQVDVKDENDYIRFCLLNAIVGKLNRYKFDASEDNSNIDSLLDMANFCCMLAEFDKSIE